MEELVFKSAKGTPITNSLLVAQKFGKEHRNVLQTVRNMTAENSAVHQMFYETTYYNEQNKQQPLFVMNRDGFTLLVMGFTGSDALQFKVDFINAFNKMENIIKSGAHQIPQTYSEALMIAARQAEQIEQLQKQNEEQRPAVVFRDSVTNADTHITVRELAKLICQNGVEIGEHRLYDYLVENKYLIRQKRWSKSKNKYETDYYEPYQCWIEKGLFFTKETVIGEGNNSFIRRTIYVTGQGQYHFVQKFLYKRENNDLSF